MLSEVVLDLAHDVAGPCVDPLLGEAVVDQMQAVVTHDVQVIGTSPIGRMGRPAYPFLGRTAVFRTMSWMEPQTEPTPEEEDASLDRREEEDAQRYPGHENPEKTIEPDQKTP